MVGQSSALKAQTGTKAATLSKVLQLVLIMRTSCMNEVI